MALLILFVCFSLLLVLGVPIAFAVGLLPMAAAGEDGVIPNPVEPKSGS